MSRLVVVRAFWDPEAAVWTAGSDDIGLATEADTVEELRRKSLLHIADLMAESGQTGEVAVEFVILAHDRVSAGEPVAA